jgi:methyltransferase of FxLD system
LRRELVDSLTEKGWISQKRVEAAFRNVPRHLFLPDLALEEVYSDKAIVTKTDNGDPVSSSSQPAIMAVMLEQLGLEEGDNVLEIGAGTGYNAALMSSLVGPSGHITTVDIDTDVVAFARQNIDRASFPDVQVVNGDGGLGYPPSAPYDALIATVGVWDLSPYWIDQLKEGRSLVAPLSFNTIQFTIGFDKVGEVLTSFNIRPCAFMRLRGAFAGPETYVEMDGLIVGVEDPARTDLESLRRLLKSPPHECQLPHLPPESGRSLIHYMALRGQDMVSLSDARRKTINCEFGLGLMKGNSSLIVLSFGSENWQDVSPSARIFGDESAAARLEEMTADWKASGQPDLALTQITAAPVGSRSAHPGGLMIHKKWMDYEIQFGSAGVP